MKHPDPDILRFCKAMLDRAMGDKDAALYLAAVKAIEHFDKRQSLERQLTELKAKTDGSINE